MSKFSSLFLAAALAVPSGAFAHPLELYWWAESDPFIGGYNYTFNLQQVDVFVGDINWIVFADVGSIAPFDAQAMDQAVLVGPAPAPFTHLQSSSGGHEGPTFLGDLDFPGWQPTGIGDTLSWEVHANNLIGDENLYWSNLIGAGPHADYELAIKVCGLGTGPPLSVLQDGVCAGSEAVCEDGAIIEPDYTIIPGFEEVEVSCDGLDNDCNGIVDDVDDAPPGDRAVGVCAGALKVCDPDFGWMEPDYEGFPFQEIIEYSCDGLDNDCDGLTDEEDPDIDPPVAGLLEGVCAGAASTCTGAGGWEDPDLFSIEGYEEEELECDGLDNDCDGEVDEYPACFDSLGTTVNCACSSGTSGAGWLVALLPLMLLRRRN